MHIQLKRFFFFSVIEISYSFFIFWLKCYMELYGVLSSLPSNFFWESSLSSNSFLTFYSHCYCWISYPSKYLNHSEKQNSVYIKISLLEKAHPHLEFHFLLSYLSPKGPEWMDVEQDLLGADLLRYCLVFHSALHMYRKNSLPCNFLENQTGHLIVQEMGMLCNHQRSPSCQ